MRRLFPVLLLTCLALTPAVARAQYGQYPVPNYGPGYRGNLSPYLNIFRGQNTGIDYYLGTRSEFQRRGDSGQFRGDIQDLRARDRVLEEDLPRPPSPVPSGTYSLMDNTGGYFNNTMNYFSNTTRQPVPPGRPGTPPARQAGRPARFGNSPFPSR